MKLLDSLKDGYEEEEKGNKDLTIKESESTESNEKKEGEKDLEGGGKVKEEEEEGSNVVHFLATIGVVKLILHSSGPGSAIASIRISG